MGRSRFAFCSDLFMTKHRRSDDTDDSLRMVIEGNEQAFADFCIRSLPQLLTIVRTRCRRFGVPADLARDFVQEALTRLIEQRDKGALEQLSIKWLVTVSRNVMIDWIRKQRRVKTLTDEQFERIPDQDQSNADLDAVLEGFGKLSSRDQEILNLVLWEGNSPAEAATRLGIEPWSAYKRYERALSRLKHIVKNDKSD